MVGWFVGWTEQIEVNQGTYPLKIYKKNGIRGHSYMLTVNNKLLR